jgi:hypothetical protein
MCDARINLIKQRTLIFKGESYASNLENIMKTNLIYENRRQQEVERIDEGPKRRTREGAVNGADKNSS